MEAIAQFRPKSWVLENPKGRLRWFLGNATATVDLSNYGRETRKPTDLWGSFTLPMVEKIMPARRWFDTKPGKLGPDNPLRSEIRAELPYGLSRALKEGFESRVLDVLASD